MHQIWSDNRKLQWVQLKHLLIDQHYKFRASLGQSRFMYSNKELHTYK